MLTESQSIKCWAEDDRPREKVMLKGKSALSDAELIAILLGSGTRTKSAVDLGQEILSACENDLYRLGKFSIADFKKFNGIGDAKAISLIAALELGRRRKDQDVKLPEKITSSKSAYQVLKPYFQDLEHEEFRVLALSRSNRIVGAPILISKGGRNETIADGKIIFKELLDRKASACILCHNHPSGNRKPSEPDIRLTKNLKQFGKLIDFNILDHLIITDSGYYSFSDEGVMP